MENPGIWNFGRIFLTVVTAAVIFFINTGNSALAGNTANEENQKSATSLLENYTSFRTQLLENAYKRPLYFESKESPDALSSSVYAVLDSSFSTVSENFIKPGSWCEVLMLHINTKHCQVNNSSVGNLNKISVNVGKKTSQPLNDTFLLEFNYEVTAATSDYFSVKLNAEKGPFSTSNYRLQFQAVPLGEKKTFIKLIYSYEYGLPGRLAMQTYLATLGRGKIGFSKINSGEKLIYVTGMRGAIERNIMRYYLAMEAHLASLKHSPANRLHAKLQYWFDATEEYSLQLHEMDRASYLAMKNTEFFR